MYYDAYLAISTEVGSGIDDERGIINCCVRW